MLAPEPVAAVSWRRLVGPAALLFVVLAVLYAPSAGLRASRSASITGDEPFYLVTTQSLLNDGDLDLRNQYEYETYRSFFDHPDRLWRQAAPLPDGRLLSPHQPGLSLLVLPGLALAGLGGAQVELLLLTALTFALAFVLAALETGRVRLAWAVTALVGLTAPAFVYATELYPDMPAALAVVAGLLVLRMRPGLLRCVATLAIVSALAWLGMKYIPAGAVLAGAFAWRSRSWERRAFFAGAAGSAVAYAGWHLATFGALTPYNTNLVYEGASTASVLDSHIAFGDRIYRIWGLFIDERFGIGRWAPLLLPILPALPLLVRKARWGGVIAALIVTQVLVATFLAITMMGWWFPGRMLIAVYPLFAVVLTVAAVHTPRPVLIMGGLAGAYSLLVTALLVGAVRAGEVTLAVDPFTMGAAPYQWLAPFFPNYTWWTAETIVLNAAWVTLLVVSTAVVALWPIRARLATWVGARTPRTVAFRPTWRRSHGQ